MVDAFALENWETTAAKIHVSREQTPSHWLQNEVRSLRKRYQVSPAINKKIVLWQGDITKLAVDAVTNAANAGLLAGAGICGAIFAAAGHDELQEACDAFPDGCPEGDAVITPAFKLPSKYVVHAVGPQGEKPKVLSRVYTNVLQRCVDKGLRSVALCCISTGIYGYPQDKAAVVALTSVRTFLESERGQALDRVVFCLFLDKDVNIYNHAARAVFPVANESAGAESTRRKRKRGNVSESDYCRLFVADIPLDAKEPELRQHCASVSGTNGITRVSIMRKRDGSGSRGFGFCEFKEDWQAEKAWMILRKRPFRGGRPLRFERVGSKKADAIQQFVLSLHGHELWDMLHQFQEMLKMDPEGTKQRLLEKPQLTQALMHAMVALAMVREKPKQETPPRPEDGRSTPTDEM